MRTVMWHMLVPVTSTKAPEDTIIPETARECASASSSWREISFISRNLIVLKYNNRVSSKLAWMKSCAWYLIMI